LYAQMDHAKSQVRDALDLTVVQFLMVKPTDVQMENVLIH